MRGYTIAPQQNCATMATADSATTFHVVLVLTAAQGAYRRVKKVIAAAATTKARFGIAIFPISLNQGSPSMKSKKDGQKCR